MPKSIPVVSIRTLPNGNVWLSCKEKCIGVLAGNRPQGLADMRAELLKQSVLEFTIRNIEDRPHGHKG